MSDQTAPFPPDERLSRARREWGPHPFGWPRPYQDEPSWWQFRRRNHEGGLRDVFGDFDRRAFWREFRKGQGFDDCGGYLMRCYRAMLDLEFITS